MPDLTASTLTRADLKEVAHQCGYRAEILQRVRPKGPFKGDSKQLGHVFSVLIDAGWSCEEIAQALRTDPNRVSVKSDYYMRFVAPARYDAQRVRAAS